MEFVDFDLELGMLVMCQQWSIGKLLPPVEGPYVFKGFANDEGTTCLIWVPNRNRIIKAHIT